MTWAVPAAWALAIAVALPIVAHLWSRRRPAAVLFPTLRFLRAASPVSRRLRRVQDWPLLLLRVAIVVAISAAAAGPTITASWRADVWRNRLHRVVVVDESVKRAAGDAVASLEPVATSMRVIDGGAAADLLEEAVSEATRDAKDRQTEIVVAWDGSRESLTLADLETIPEAMGIRLLVLRRDAADATSAGFDVTVEAAESDVAIRDRLLDMVRPGAEGRPYPDAPASAGSAPAPAGSALRVRPDSPPLVFVWPGATRTQADAAVPATPSALRVLDDVADDVRVRDAAERSVRDSRASGGEHSLTERTLATGPDGESLLRGRIEGNRVVFTLDATPSSPLSLWALIAAVESTRWSGGAPTRWSERASATSSAWGRDAIARIERAPTTPADVTLPGGLDTRAAWAVALVLLLVEQWWRRRGAPAVDREVADAA
ncbi:MAG: BatA domain-containing protein [Acidobacteria bacterium]|nr:BatA domain-containing protein [Acidobacteriota bacterium]